MITWLVDERILDALCIWPTAVTVRLIETKFSHHDGPVIGAVVVLQVHRAVCVRVQAGLNLVASRCAALVVMDLVEYFVLEGIRRRSESFAVPCLASNKVS